MKFTPIKQKKVSVQIADQIRDAILRGEFKPGDKLPPERELAEMFGVSRPSVREALNIIASTGLVMSYQGGGTVVLSLVDTDSSALSELIRTQKERALEVIEVRRCMEAWTAFFAAQRAKAEDIRQMEEIMAAMEARLEEGKALEELDALLHLQIARATHNIIWYHLVQGIFDAMKDFQRGVWRTVYSIGDDTRLLLDHHIKIIAAIRNQDGEAARQAMMEHLSFAEQRSAAYISKNRSVHP